MESEGEREGRKEATERKIWQLGWSSVIFPKEFQFWEQKTYCREQMVAEKVSWRPL